jgi:hypothetical protein
MLSVRMAVSKLVFSLTLVGKMPLGLVYCLEGLSLRHLGKFIGCDRAIYVSKSTQIEWTVAKVSCPTRLPNLLRLAIQCLYALQQAHRWSDPEWWKLHRSALYWYR